MKKTLKKSLFLLLTLCMVLGLSAGLSVTAYAAVPAAGGVIDELTSTELDRVLGAGNYTLSGTIIELQEDLTTADSITLAVTCTLNLNEMTIDRNLTAAPTDGKGGSVLIIGQADATSVTVTIPYSNGCELINGYAENGGGIAVVNGTLNARAVTISGCDASGNGGGVYVADGSTLNMGDITVTGNTALGSGGGVYVADGAAITTEDTTVRDNVSTSDGGGVYVAGSFDIRNTYNNTRIQNNKKGDVGNNVYLPSGKTISISGELSTSAKIYVTTAGVPDDTTPVSITGVCTKDFFDRFYSDNANYNVYSDKDTEGKYTLKLTTASDLPAFTLGLTPADGSAYQSGGKNLVNTGRPLSYDIMLTQTNNYARSTVVGMYVYCSISYDPNLTFVSTDLSSRTLINTGSTLDLRGYLDSASITKNTPKKIGTVTFATPDRAFISANGTNGEYKIGDISLSASGTGELGVTLSQYQAMFPMTAAQSSVYVCTESSIPLTAEWSNLTAVYNNANQKPTVSLMETVTDDVSVVVNGAYKNPDAYTVTATLTGTDAGKYTLTNPTATFTIEKAPVTFTITNDFQKHTGGTLKATVTAATGYSTNFTYIKITYEQNGVTVASPTEVGSYDIMAKINSSYCRHADSIDGSIRKIGVLTIYEDTPPATYALTFAGNENDGGATTALPAAQSGSKRILPACGFTKTDHLFTGWSYGGKVYQPGESFFQPEDNVTMTAQWEEQFAISGAVEQDDIGMQGVIVTLFLGSKQIAQTTAGLDGAYSFTDVSPGVYNLRAEYCGVIKTIYVTITTENADDQNITLPAGKTNSVVEIAAGAPTMVIGNLEQTVEGEHSVLDTDDQSALNAGGEVTVKLTATVTDPTKTTIINEMETDIETAIENVAQGEVDLLIDVDVTKTVKDAEGRQLSSAPVNETDVLLTALIQLPGNLQGRTGYTVYREHGAAPNTTIDILSSTPNADGEYIVVNPEKTHITVYMKKFSTLAVAGQDTLTVSFDASGGDCATTTMQTDDSGKLSGLPTPTKAGSRFDGWYLSDGTKVTEDTVFTTNEAATAKWLAPGGTTTAYPITVPGETAGGTAQADAVTAARGTTVTITVALEEGYALAALTAVDADGNEIPLTDEGNGRYSFTMPASAVTVTPVFARIVFDPNATGVADHLQAVDHILYIHGYTDGSVGPARSMTRGEAAQMFFNLLLSKDADSTATFTDVPDTMWCAEAVGALASLGVIEGYGNDKFGPQDPMTREQFCAMAVRFATKIKAGELAYSKSFPDVAKTGWAYDSVMTAAALGWVNGYTNGNFGPMDDITRAEVVTIVNHMLGRCADKAFVDATSGLKTFSDLSKTHWAYYDIMEATNAHDYKKSGSTETWLKLK